MISSIRDYFLGLFLAVKEWSTVSCARSLSPPETPRFSIKNDLMTLDY